MGVRESGNNPFHIEPGVNDTHQVIQRKWQELIYGGTPDLVGRLEKFDEESRETIAEIEGERLDFINNLPPDRSRALAGEVVDTMIAGLGILDVLGFSFEQLFFEKMQTMYEKYNPGKIDTMTQEGLTRNEAISKAKQQWNVANGK